MTAKTPAAPAGPILSLDTLEPPRPTVRIDGEPYELALLSDFDLLQRARLSRLLDDVGAIQREAAKEQTKRAFNALSENHARRLEKILDEAIDMIVRAPAAVLRRLHNDQELAVIAAFTPTLRPSGAAVETKDRSTSGRLSRTSPTSTAPVPG